MAEGAALLEVADALYARSLTDFTPARDAKVRELKGSELAPRVKALKKPSLAAWVVNLLARRDADQVAQVLAVGEALREAQAAMSADELRALTRQRRQLTAAVTQQARSLAAEEGVRVTQAVADQVEATLTAAMVDETCAAAVRSGLLVAPLSATGVDEVAVASAVAVPEALGFTARPRQAEERERPELAVVPDPEADRKAVAAARERLDEAEQEVAQVRAAYDDAVGDVARLEARAMQVQAEIDEFRRRLAELETQAEDIDEEIAEAEDARAEAEHVLAEATRARDRAQAALDRLP